MTMLPALTLAPLQSRRSQSEDTLQVVCFPPAGGGFASFLPFVRPHGDQQEEAHQGLVFWGIQIAWEADLRFDGLVSALTDAVLLQVRVPFAFWGESLGALLAYEVANDLRTRQTQEPRGLVVVGMAAPQLYCPPPTAEWSEAEWRSELRRMGGPAAAGRDAPAVLASRIQGLADAARLARTYQYQEAPPFDFPIAVMGGEHDQVFPPDLLMGWKAHTHQDCSVVVFPRMGHADLLERSALRTQVWQEGMARIQHWREVRV